jgi:predicted DNA binding protein
MITVEFETDNAILRSSRQAVPQMAITVDAEQSTAAGDGDDIRLLFWASGGDFEAFDRKLDEDPSVRDPVVLTETNRRRLYRVIIAGEGVEDAAYSTMVQLDGVLLHAESTDTGWFVRMQFPDRAAVVEFQSWFDDNDLPFNITGIYEEAETPETGLGPNLTEIQRETLMAAYDVGYFDIPRERSLVEFADELGVSDTAVSQRLRRGMKKIVEYDLMQDRDRN